MTQNDLREQIIKATHTMLDASGLLVLSPAQQEVIRALNRAVLKDTVIVEKWYEELPADMKDSSDE